MARRELTLVAFYGDKPEALGTLIEASQRRLDRELGAAFIPYEPAQVHATIIGLERDPQSRGMVNRNFRVHRAVESTMDIPGFIALVEESFLPFSVQIGGFRKGDQPFLSRAAAPFDRSFSLQGDKAVLMGWPVVRAAALPYPSTLDRLRAAARQFGILHDYHRHPNEVDNDFYFRVGVLDSGMTVDAEQRASIESAIRLELAEQPPILLDVVPESLSVVAYEDNTLPIASSTEVKITDIRSADDVARLLAELPA